MKLPRDKLPLFNPSEQVIYRVIGNREGVYATGVIKFIEYNPDSETWHYVISTSGPRGETHIPESHIQYLLQGDTWQSTRFGDPDSAE